VAEKERVILVVDNSRAITGALNAMRHATGPLRNQFGYQFEYVLPTGSTGRQVLEADGYVVHELPFVEISRRKQDMLRYFPMLLLNGWRLFNLARLRGAQIIHLNDFYNLTGYIAQLLSMGRLHIVTHVRFLPQTQVQALALTWRWFAQSFANKVLCVSQAVRHYFGQNSKVQVVYDPLPTAELYPPPPPSAHRPDGSVQMLYLSNFIVGKGQNFALAAFKLAYNKQPSLRLHFVGGDMGMQKNQEFKQQLQQETRDLGLEAAVKFSGFVNEVEQAMKQADIILNFSESESFSLTCLDALYYGVPLIATDCGGPAELFENGKSGLLVPNRNVAAMADAIIELAGNIDQRRAFSSASRSFVRQKFAPAYTYLALADCYQAVLAKR